MCKHAKGACFSDKVHTDTRERAKKNIITCLESVAKPKHVAILCTQISYDRCQIKGRQWSAAKLKIRCKNGWCKIEKSSLGQGGNWPQSERCALHRTPGPRHPLHMYPLVSTWPAVPCCGELTEMITKTCKSMINRSMTDNHDLFLLLSGGLPCSVYKWQHMLRYWTSTAVIEHLGTVYSFFLPLLSFTRLQGVAWQWVL